MEKIKKSSWIKGLTQETDERVRLLVEKGRETQRRHHREGKIKTSPNWIFSQKDKPHSLEHKQKIAKSHIGLRPTEKTREKLKYAAQHRIITPLRKLHMRESAIKRLEKRKLNGEPFSPRISTKEKYILDILEKCLTYKIIPQYTVNGYFIDGYCPALNLAIEIDEPTHYIDNNIIDGVLKEKDIIRQKEIEDKLHCKFLRIPMRR